MAQLWIVRRPDTDMQTILLLVPFVVAVIVILRLLFGARVMNHIVAICVGVIVGFFFAFLALWSGDSPSHTIPNAVDLIDMPVTWLCSLLTHAGVGQERVGKLWFLFYFSYWSLIGGLVYFGVAFGWAKLKSDE